MTVRTDPLSASCPWPALGATYSYAYHILPTDQGKANRTQHDLEDLPTTWGGDDKLPVRAKLFANAGVPIVAMRGNFHTSWGEFGGFKHPDAIRCEAASMIAFGAAYNFGDQLHLWAR